MSTPDPKPRASDPQRRQRRSRRIWSTLPLNFGWIFGLILTTAIIYSSVLAYQRWTEAEARLEALEYRAIFITAPTHSAALAADTPSPMRTAAQSVPTTLWTAGTWEREAQRYIRDNLAQATTSANPPQHRQRDR